MNVTRDVVIDLLPLYYSKECSRDTKTLVEEYLKTDPDFEKLANRFAQNLLSKSIPQQLSEEDEMKSLSKTRRQLRLRSFILALAIFFSIVPFSFAYTGGSFICCFPSRLRARLFTASSEWHSGPGTLY